MREYLANHPLRTQLEAALAHGGGAHSLEDVADAVARHDAQIWEAPGALLITEVHNAPQLKELHFWLAAGELEPVLALSEHVMIWGRALGCTAATLTGRKGWTKVMQRRGWNSQMVTMGRKL